MADSFIQVAPDSTGKQMQTYLNTISGQPVHSEAIVLVDPSGVPITTLPVSIASNINIGTNINISGPITVQQSNASNFLCTVSGTVTANAGTNLNTANVSVKIFQGAAFMACGQVAATNVASTLVAARATRRSVTVRNLDSINSGYVGIPNATASNSMLFQPKDSQSIDFVGTISVITSSGNANFAYMETYD